MKISNKGVSALKRAEDVRKYMYLDQIGLPTIGVGHLLTKDELSSGKIALPATVHWRDGLTDDEVDAILREDLNDAENAINDLVSVELTQNQFDALVSFVFNVGMTAFADSTLLRKLNAGEYSAVPAQMRRWIYAAGRKLPGLIKRREKEIEMWEGKAEEPA